jgi:hypothetical protein
MPRAINRTICGRSGYPSQGAEADSCHFPGALTKCTLEHG